MSAKKKFVAKATSSLGWRIYNIKQKRWWGEYYKDYPTELLKELNGKRRPEIISDLTRQLQLL